jgi:hypothetical protein
MAEIGSDWQLVGVVVTAWFDAATVPVPCRAQGSPPNAIRAAVQRASL